MAGSYNKTLLIGYLGRDPETRTTPTGERVSNFNVACTESWQGRDGQRQERTTWFGCAAFGKLAETCSRYLHKGSYVYLEGTLSLREYTDREGARRSSLDLRIREMRMLDKAGAAVDVAVTDDLVAQVRAESPSEVGTVPEDIPF